MALASSFAVVEPGAEDVDQVPNRVVSEETLGDSGRSDWITGFEEPLCPRSAISRYVDGDADEKQESVRDESVHLLWASSGDCLHVAVHLVAAPPDGVAYL